MPSVQEAEAGGLPGVWGEPRLYSKSLSHKENNVAETWEDYYQGIKQNADCPGLEQFTDTRICFFK